MNALKIVIVSVFFLKLFGFELYLPIDFKDVTLNNVTIKRYTSLKEVNFTNSLVMVNYNNLPFIFDKDLVIITPIGEVNEYILSNRKSLSEIRTIANVDFATKVLLSRVNNHYREVNASLEDFLEKKVNAIVVSDKIERDGIINFNLKSYGIDFNKYFIVASRDFIRKNYEDIGVLNRLFEDNFDFRKDLVYKTLVLSAFYLNKKIDFNKILFENYSLKDINTEFLEVDVTKNWPPFHMYKNGHIYGMGVDFWKLIAKKAHLDYRINVVPYWTEVLRDIKEKKSDLTIDTSFTDFRSKYAIFSKPYVSFPLGIVCRGDKHFDSISDISSIAVGRHYTAERLMKEHYPDLNYVETKDTFEALEMIERKEVDCAVDVLPVILYLINKNHLMNLQLAFKTPFKFDVQIMIRSDLPDVLDKINKAIDSITPKEREEIVNNYLKSIIIEQNHSLNKFLLGLVLFVVVLGIVIVLFNKKKIEKAQKEALYDELTGILNRRGIDYKIKNLEKGSILFFDIDHFKRVNDTYGHEFGDYVLTQIGKILKKNFRKNDIIGRWGGEEFIVILPNTSYEDALKLAEKLRKIIEKHDFKGKKITVSIGVSEYNGNLEEELEKADEALYEAKNSGRNQVKGRK